MGTEEALIPADSIPWDDIAEIAVYARAIPGARRVCAWLSAARPRH